MAKKSGLLGIYLCAFTRLTRVYSRGEKQRGYAVGLRACNLEGCLGCRVGVRWDDGKLTWPCTKGMKVVRKSEDRGETILHMRIE